MADFNDYLGIHGNIKHCWDVHKRVMQEKGLPYVSYNSFYGRVKRYGWRVYEAIHTPGEISKRNYRVKAGVWEKIRLWLKHIFRKIYKSF